MVSVKITKVFLVKINIFNISTYKHEELSVGGEISREAEVGFYNFEKKISGKIWLISIKIVFIVSRFKPVLN